ncbi:Formate dehydrogenase [Rhizorhabdus wittichii RW1]|uniref:Formate dehydrogenase n=1 Tax=Rhizorhabdus wittichii (strain DSM 6014 / CCUG 31198 / JCM 15750 / NBRC 105917 / EY 4224 / RW1) TaxID=392499 RepID=A0A9J9HF36_RHIWR|nr:Formate dehydrogenase [Rhizorhabdus wittichii RW1]
MAASEDRTKSVRTYCRICPAGCGMIADVVDGKVVGVRGDKAHPLSYGYLCPKGQASAKAHNSPHRLDRPLMRSSGTLSPASWDDAMDDIGGKLVEIRQASGPDAIGVYFGTAGFFDTGGMFSFPFIGQLGTTSLYTATSVDSPGYQLVAERMSGNHWLLPKPDRDANFVILNGINPIVSHGHNFFMAAPKAQLRKWAARGGLWVIDPRLTESAEIATGHLRPLPGTEYALFGFLIRSLLADGGADVEFLRDFCSNVDSLRDSVAPFDLDAAASITHIEQSEILRLLAGIRQAGRIALQLGTGTSMSKNANVTTWLGWALNAVTGSLDRPGGMWINRGMLQDLAKVGWQPTNTTRPGPKSRPDLPGRAGQMPSGALIDEIEAGNLRALIVVGGNPVIALPDTRRLTAALGKLDLLVVLDVLPTGTTELATHVLPCTGQLERADISMGDIAYTREFAQYAPRVVPPGAERRPTWWILGELGRRLGIEIAPPDPDADEAALFRPLAAAPRFDIAAFDGDTAVSFLEEECSFGWVSRFLPDNRWNLAPEELVEQLKHSTPPGCDPEALLLIPSRQRHKINSTFNDGIADRHGHSLPGLYISERDAARFGLEPGGLAEVASATGKLVVTVHIDRRMGDGCVSIPHGFERANVGHLTSTRINTDPLSGMIEQSGVEVRVRPIGPP